jgi:hypothetical protein
MADDDGGSPWGVASLFSVETAVGLVVALVTFSLLVGSLSPLAANVAAVVVGLAVANGLSWYRNR